MANKNQINRIAIIGLGLIGGSIAKALKQVGYYVVGITKNISTVKAAKKENAIDIGYCELTSDIFKDIDLIFIATPLSLISNYIEKLGKLVQNEMILTDVGSTKSEICKIAEKLLPSNITFIGGHPMAGNENSGYKFAKSNLFKNALWVLTPALNTEESNKKLIMLEGIIKELSAIPIVIDPQKHDEAVALISHMPLLASIGLCNLVKNLEDENLQKIAILLAAGGFRDTTRIASGNPELSKDLIVSNLMQIADLLPMYYEEMEKLLKLAGENHEKLAEIILSVRNWRKNL